MVPHYIPAHGYEDGRTNNAWELAWEPCSDLPPMSSILLMMLLLIVVNLQHGVPHVKQEMHQ